MIRQLREMVRSQPYLFNRIFPIYTKINLKRRQVWKRLSYGSQMLSSIGGSTAIESAIRNRAPVAAGKIGTSELIALQYRLADRELDDHLKREVFLLSGFFPFEKEPVRRFQDTFSEVLGKMTHIAVWGNIGEASIIRKFGSQAVLIDRQTLEPHKVPYPWTAALAGRKVVVISPFHRSIEKQYRKRLSIWRSHPNVLPEFDLRTVRSPFSPGLVTPKEADWFERLERIWDAVCSQDFDVCLIGAGGLSLPLATRCAEIGKVGIHMGGYTQIHFGIWGSRWNHDKTLTAIKNEDWAKPMPEETPENSHLQDNNSYW